MTSRWIAAMFVVACGGPTGPAGDVASSAPGPPDVDEVDPDGPEGTGDTAGADESTGDTGTTAALPGAMRQVGLQLADDIVVSWAALGFEDFLGLRIASTDFDGDGWLDLLATYHVDLGVERVVRAAVYPGPLSGAVDAATPSMLFEAPAESLVTTTYNVESIGDLNADGKGDVALSVLPLGDGAELTDPLFTLVYGGITGEAATVDVAFSALTTPEASDIGWEVVVGGFGAGGASLLAVGAPGLDPLNAGAVLLLDPASLPPTGVVEDVAVGRLDAMDGAAGLQECGLAVADSGDVDGDGIHDLAIGCGYTDAYVVPGGMAPATARIADVASFVVDTAIPVEMAGGDLDGDGHSDVALAPGLILTPGKVGVFLSAWVGGDTVFNQAELRIEGEVNIGYLGHQIRIADFDLDNQDDLVLGNQMGALFSASGAARVYYGPVPTGHISVLTANLDVEPDYVVINNQFSWDLDVADLTGDGLPDPVGSAIYDNPGGVIYGLAGLPP